MVMEDLHHHTATIKYILDAIAAGIAGGAIVGILPPIAAFLSIIWISFQIYDRVKYGPRRNQEQEEKVDRD